MLFLISTSLIGAFILSMVIRSKGFNAFLTFIMASLITDVSILVYSSFAGTLMENPFSIFENFRVVVLCFVGFMVAELLFLLRDDLQHR